MSSSLRGDEVGMTGHTTIARFQVLFCSDRLGHQPFAYQIPIGAKLERVCSLTGLALVYVAVLFHPGYNARLHACTVTARLPGKSASPHQADFGRVEGSVFSESGKACIERKPLERKKEPKVPPKPSRVARPPLEGPGSSLPNRTASSLHQWSMSAIRSTLALARRGKARVGELQTRKT